MKNKSLKSKRLGKRKAQVPLYLKSVTPLVLFVRPNGKLNPVARIVGFNIEEILINCTQIMKLTSAARKLYSNDGKLIQSINELNPHDEVFVSVGEPFVDPNKLIKESIIIQEGSFWGLNGLYIPKSKRKSASASPKYGQTEKMWRIVTFANGDYLMTEALEILSDMKNIDELKEICSTKIPCNGPCKRLFLSNYLELFDINQLLEEEPVVWYPNNSIKILGPIWICRNEDLDQSAVYNYFLQIIKAINHRLKQSKSCLQELAAMENGDLDNVRSSSIKSYSKPELKVRKEEFAEEVDKLERELQKLSHRLQNLPKPASQTSPKQDQDAINAFKSTKGLRLKVYQNGQDAENKFVIFFNVQQAKRGINDRTVIFHRFLDCLSENACLSKTNTFTKGVLARRVFTENGQEIFSVDQLSYDQVLCVSYGEDWIDPAYFCACAKIHLLNSNLEWAMFDLEINSQSLKEFGVCKQYNESDHKTHGLPVLQNQKNRNMFLMASLSVKDRNVRDDSIIKLWMYTQSGRLILKSIQSLCLTLCRDHIESMKINKCSLKTAISESNENDIVEINVYPVQLCKVSAHDPTQMWHFNDMGLLENKACPGFFLTYFENRTSDCIDDISVVVKNCNMLAADVLPDNLQMYQRWAFKQESFSNLSQWKLCDFPNAEWHKTALTWPLKSNGELNTDLKWPIEGLLVPCTPSLASRKFYLQTRFPRKLFVYKNNDHIMKQPVLVMGPDLGKLVKNGMDEQSLTHCSNETLLKLEFQMFLDSCTNLLRLSSAARRLFDEIGDELFDLNGLSNKDTVIVSTGDMWSSPVKTLSRIELRIFYNKLVVDIERLKYFISLYLPNQEFVLGIKNNTIEEVGTLEIQLLNKLSKHIIKRLYDEDHHIPSPEPEKEVSIDESLKPKTFHEKTCDAARLRANPKPKPITLNEKKPKPDLIPHLNLQQFLYQSNKIFLLCNQQFCVFADEIGKPLVVRKLGQDTNNNKCQWIVHRSGLIESMHYRGYVIGIQCPRMLPFQDKAPGGYLESAIILEKALNIDFGRAHQVLKIDPRSGLFYPFSTTVLDKNITAALLAGICTRYICSKPINQSGSYVEVNSENKPSCLSCVTVMNGRYPISAMGTDEKQFVCAHSGGFKVINKDVDLSASKAEEVYRYFLGVLETTRQQLRIKVCKSRFSDKSSPNIQVLVHLNHNPNLLPPQRITGKSVIQIMELATAIFNLQRPVRILYTIKGEEIVDDLSFRNIMGQINNRVTSADGDKKSGPVLESGETIKSREMKDTEEELARFNVSLSEDQRYFIVEFADKQPLNGYTLQINISSVQGIHIFRELAGHQDSAFLFNYEIFNNQINTELFLGDSDFEGEQTELSIRSSPEALIYLFSKIMSTLRLQLISARVNKNDNQDEDFQVDIESIDAIADFSFVDLVDKIAKGNFDEFSTMITMPLVSTDTFMTTTASLVFGLFLKQNSEIQPQLHKEAPSVETDSLVNEARYVPVEFPIDLWASIGEVFCHPKTSANRHKKIRKEENQINQLKLEIDKKKFLLRTMKGERFKRLNPGTLTSTPSEKNPVTIKDNWQFPTAGEIQLIEEIEKLKKNLIGNKKSDVSKVTLPIDFSRSLYKQKRLKHCLVHVNGQKENTAVTVWGETIWEILENSSRLLGIKKIPNYIFNKSGKSVTKFDEIYPGEVLSVSHNSEYVSPLESEMQCEIKANWGRARRQYGEGSTELKIQYRPNTVIDIDPFEPPQIMRTTRALSSKQAKSIKIFENGQMISTAKEITGHTLAELLKKATSILDSSLPVKCFYALDGKRITDFKEILHDDLLAASVSGKGLLTRDDN